MLPQAKDTITPPQEMAQLMLYMASMIAGVMSQDPSASFVSPLQPQKFVNAVLTDLLL